MTNNKSSIQWNQLSDKGAYVDVSLKDHRKFIYTCADLALTGSYLIKQEQLLLIALLTLPVDNSF